MPNERSHRCSYRTVPQAPDTINLDSPSQNRPPYLSLCLQRRLERINRSKDHPEQGGCEGRKDCLEQGR